MSVLAWGKPTIEYIKLVKDTIPESGWQEMPNPKQDSFAMNTQDGEVKQAFGEGGILVDEIRSAATTTIEFDIFAAGVGFEMPIPAENGLISDNYAIRVTPQDSKLTGIIFKRASVAVSTSWTAEDGILHHYTFTALQPKDNSAMVGPYTAESK